MPLALSFVLIGFFLWVAENLATYVGAWRYPYQLHGWQPVGVGKFGAWAMLISVTFVLAALGRSRTPSPTRSLFTWVTQSRFGCALMPRTCTWRVATSMTNSTYSRRQNPVSTWKKSQASSPEAWARRKEAQAS